MVESWNACTPHPTPPSLAPSAAKSARPRCFLGQFQSKNNAILSLPGCGSEIGAGQFLFVLPLAELHSGDLADSTV